MAFGTVGVIRYAQGALLKGEKHSMSYNHLLLFHLWFLIPVAYKQLPSPMITLQLKKLDVLRSCFSFKNQLLLQLRMIYIDCFSSKGRDVYQNRSNFSSPCLHCSKVVPWLFDLWIGIFRERRVIGLKNYLKENAGWPMCIR